ncbi:MAG: ATP-binding protein [Gammaproteobacteria bacterium]
MKPSAANSTSRYSTLTIANQYGDLVRVTTWLNKLAKQLHLSERTVFKLELVLDEALPNIISYGYRDQERHVIHINLKDSCDHVILEIVDDGIPFNPFAQEALQEQLPLESASIDGRGIRLINFFTEAQEYRRVNQTNLMRVNILKTSEADIFTSATLVK